jgi:hypothetical protein
MGADKKVVSFDCADLPKSEVRGISCFDLAGSPKKFARKRFKVTFCEETNFIKEASSSVQWN